MKPRQAIVPYHGMEPEDFGGPFYDGPMTGHASTLPMSPAQKAAIRKRKKRPIGFAAGKPK